MPFSSIWQSQCINYGMPLFDYQYLLFLGRRFSEIEMKTLVTEVHIISSIRNILVSAITQFPYPLSSLGPGVKLFLQVTMVFIWISPYSGHIWRYVCREVHGNFYTWT